MEGFAQLQKEKIKGVVMTVKCAIFTENDKGPQDLEIRIDNFFEDMEDVEVCSTNVATKRENGVDFCTVFVFYK
jgi:hypothetical protein